MKRRGHKPKPGSLWLGWSMKGKKQYGWAGNPDARLLRRIKKLEKEEPDEFVADLIDAGIIAPPKEGVEITLKLTRATRKRLQNRGLSDKQIDKARLEIFEEMSRADKTATMTTTEAEERILKYYHKRKAGRRW